MLLLTAYFSFKGQSETWLSFSHLELTKSHKGMYKLSYVVRVSADDLDELKRRCDEVKDFYDDLNVKLVRPAGDMLGFENMLLQILLTSLLSLTWKICIFRIHHFK